MALMAFEIFVLSIAAGVFGSILGLGGGIIITPVLTLIFGIDIRYAIGASIVSVIATSSGAAAAYVRDKITNVRVGMFLEIGTTLGAITGAFIAGIINTKYLYIIFGLMLLYSAISMFKGRNKKTESNDIIFNEKADRLKLNGEYYDKVLNKTIKYNVTGVYKGLFGMYGAGIASGLLGIGSGIFKVPIMDMVMKLPLKVSSATSNFMIGVTAATSAGVYLLRGDINPKIAGPVALGVLVGAAIGSRIMENIKSETIRKIFIPVVAYVSIEMIIKGFKL